VPKMGEICHSHPTKTEILISSPFFILYVRRPTRERDDHNGNGNDNTVRNRNSSTIGYTISIRKTNNPKKTGYRRVTTSPFFLFFIC
jgi:hypothetical protein